MKGRLAASWILLKTGDAARAREQAELALALAKEKTLDGKPSAWVGTAYLLRAHALSTAGDAAGARQDLELARAQIDGSVGAGHPLRRLAALPAAVHASN
jgi:hypothetical protein